MSGCGNCCGNCGGCGEMVLTPGEIEMLRTLGQFAFLPVARKADATTPIYLEETEYSVEEYSLILQCLEKRGLISIDFDKPLKRGYKESYVPYPIRGSFALTSKGLDVLDLLEKHGFAE